MGARRGSHGRWHVLKLDAVAAWGTCESELQLRIFIELVRCRVFQRSPSTHVLTRAWSLRPHTPPIRGVQALGRRRRARVECPRVARRTPWYQPRGQVRGATACRPGARTGTSKSVYDRLTHDPWPLASEETVASVPPTTSTQRPGGNHRTPQLSRVALFCGSVIGATRKPSKKKYVSLCTQAAASSGHA